MSLGFALDVTTRGLLSTANRIQVTSGNITNADKPGYTRKEARDTFTTTNGGSIPVRATIVGAADRFISKTVINDQNLMGMRDVISQYLDLYAKQLGNTGGSQTMPGYLNDMFGALQQLATSPETLANKTEFVSLASNLSASLRALSIDIQSQRTEVDKRIGESVTQINDSLRTLEELNRKIQNGQINSSALAEYEDQRLFELQKLSKEMDIQYFFAADNTVQVFTGGGQPLLLSSARTLSYNVTTLVNGSVQYPLGFSPITLNGIDITTQLQGGALAGLVDLRDNVFVSEQAKLDEFAVTLQRETNLVLNNGASRPPRPTLTGSLDGLTAGTAFSGTGIVRVAITDNNGVVNNFQDVNIGALGTVGDVITALNGIPNINASLNGNGELVIASTLANTGVSINNMTSNVTPGNVGFQSYFGLNDLFIGTSAEDINIAQYLQQSSTYLAVGSLSNSATLAAGDSAVALGDGSVALALANRLDASVSFAAAGNFSAQSNSLKSYIEAFVADAANTARIAENEANTAELTFRETSDLLQNKTGVNIDEETARLLELQNKYQASARLIQTIRELFQTLIDAVR